MCNHLYVVYVMSQKIYCATHNLFIVFYTLPSFAMSIFYLFHHTFLLTSSLLSLRLWLSLVSSFDPYIRDLSSVIYGCCYALFVYSILMRQSARVPKVFYFTFHAVGIARGPISQGRPGGDAE